MSDYLATPPADERLWAVHYRGPDSIVAAASHDEAVNAMAWADRADAANRRESDLYPMLSAQVTEWPFTAEAHAEDLLQGPGL